MKQIHFTKFISVLLILCLIGSTCGCVATERATVTGLTQYTNKPIVVLAPGGSQYRLWHWSRSDSTIISLEGEVNYPSMSPGSFEQFSGAIPIDSVAEIQVVIDSTVETVANIAALAAVVAFIVIMVDQFRHSFSIDWGPLL